MSKTSKLLLGISTLGPIIYTICFLVFIFSLFTLANNNPNMFNGSISSFAVLFIVHLLAIMWNIVLLMIYFRHLFNNQKIAQEQKVLWAIILFMGSMIAMPIYWYMYIWKEEKANI